MTSAAGIVVECRGSNGLPADIAPCLVFGTDDVVQDRISMGVLGAQLVSADDTRFEVRPTARLVVF